MSDSFTGPKTKAPMPRDASAVPERAQSTSPTWSAARPAGRGERSSACAKVIACSTTGRPSTPDQVRGGFSASCESGTPPSAFCWRFVDVKPLEAMGDDAIGLDASGGGGIGDGAIGLDADGHAG